METTPSSIKLTTRDDLSVLYRVVKYVIRPFKPRLAEPGKPLPAGSPKLTPASVGCRVEQRQVEDIYLYDFELPTGTTRKTPSKPDAHHIYYFAGGGFKSAATKDHWKLCAEIQKQLSGLYKVSLVSYPLAPNSPASDSLPKMQKWMRNICADAEKHGKKVTLVGDSAGGNLVLLLAFWWASQISGDAASSPLSNIMAISPATDLRNQNPKSQEAEKYDPVLTIKFSNEAHKAWIGDLSAESPEISPNMGDFKKLKASSVRIHGVVGTHDILAPDAIVFRELCAENGIEGEWLQWEGQMHCFPLTFNYGLSEGKEGKDWIIDVLRRHA